jgi:lysophospholipase L1-like esterase
MLAGFPGTKEKPMASLRFVTVVGLLAAAAALGSQAPAQQAAPNQDKAEKKGNPATDAQPRKDDAWVARQKELNERAKKGGAELLFLGDSITEGWEGGGKEVWDKHFGPRKALNLGISGDQTQHVLWRLDHGNVDGLAPKAAVVMIGTNNTNGGQTAEQIAEGVQKITEKLGEKLPKTKVLLLAIFPRGEKPNPQRELIASINAKLAKLADGKRVHFLDIGPKFVGADGTIDKAVMPDFLHLSPKGYAIWADAIEADLKKLLDEK